MNYLDETRETAATEAAGIALAPLRQRANERRQPFDVGRPVRRELVKDRTERPLPDQAIALLQVGLHLRTTGSEWPSQHGSTFAFCRLVLETGSLSWSELAHRTWREVVARAEDGDPLDVLVLMDAPVFPGCIVPSRLIGVIEAEQTEGESTERNDRLLAVAANSAAHRFQGFCQIGQLLREGSRESGRRDARHAK